MNSRILGGGLAAALALATPCVAYYEGCVPKTYVDPVGIPTVCYGHTGHDVKRGQVATTEQCKSLLSSDLAEAAEAVRECVQIDLQPWQAAALISFAHNVGGHALCGSTLARMANSGAPPEIWCSQLRRWTHATKLGVTVELPGLVKRRAAETKMCLGETT